MPLRSPILEAVPLGVARSNLNAGALSGSLYPLNPKGATSMGAASIGVKVTTNGLGGVMRAALYTYAYTASATWSGRFIGMTGGFVANTTLTRLDFDLVVPLDFTNFRYMIGLVLPDTTARVAGLDYGANGYGAVKLTSPMADSGSWPITVDQTTTTPVTFLPYLSILSSKALFFF